MDTFFVIPLGRGLKAPSTSYLSSNSWMTREAKPFARLYLTAILSTGLTGDTKGGTEFALLDEPVHESKKTASLYFLK